jgi:hypothetical protein
LSLKLHKYTQPVNLLQGLLEGRGFSFFLELFLSKNSIKECLEHNWEQKTNRAEVSPIEGPVPTREREKKKKKKRKRKKKEISRSFLKLSFTLMIVSETGVANGYPLNPLI